MPTSKLLNILLVDDDDLDVMNVRRAFKKNNILNTLYIAGNGEEALAILRDTSGAPGTLPRERRLILLDLNMPRMGGLEFLRHLRADAALKTISVVVLTASNEDGDKIEAYNSNVAGYIVKPVMLTNFVAMMVALNKYWMLSELP